MGSCPIPSLAPLLGTEACLPPHRPAASCLCDRKGTLKVLTLLLEAIYILYPKMASLPGSTVKAYSEAFAAGPVEVTGTRFVLCCDRFGQNAQKRVFSSWAGGKAAATAETEPCSSAFPAWGSRVLSQAEVLIRGGGRDQEQRLERLRWSEYLCAGY